MKKIKKHLTFKNILLLIYIIITFITTIKHEPWRDEAQAWLIKYYRHNQTNEI